MVSVFISLLLTGECPSAMTKAAKIRHNVCTLFLVPRRTAVLFATKTAQPVSKCIKKKEKTLSGGVVGG
jgi:hypothetical protein